MTSRTPRRHRRLAFLAAGTAAAMVLLPGAASAQVVHSAQQVMGANGPTGPGGPEVPKPSTPDVPALPAAPGGPIDGPGTPGDVGDAISKVTDIIGGKQGTPGLTGARDEHHGEGHDGEVVHREDTPDSHDVNDPHGPDHARGAVADIDIIKSHLLDITKYDATIEDDGKSHSEVTVLGLGGSRIIGSKADSRDHHRSGDNGDALKLCGTTGGLLCLSLLYHNTVATEDHDNSLAAARGGVAALCLGSHDKDSTTSYECNGILSLGVAEGLGIAERDKRAGHTKADSANELLNLCIGKRDKLTTPCSGLGLEAVHSESKSRSDKPDTDRHSFLLGIDSNGHSSYLLDAPFGLALPDHCGDSAILCLLLNQGKSVIFKNPKGAGSAQEALRLDVLNRLVLVVLGQAETFAHETNDHSDHHEGNKDHGPEGKGEEHGEGENNGGEKGPELAQTGADVAGLLAGGFLLAGLGALTVAGTRRRSGSHAQ
ncbi:MAG TPA: hypothetical protein VFO16_00175 [Pseudonocardiaceae bacterium]|nr:hypothetical protein [Pseudonocardiaceae bacterium]